MSTQNPTSTPDLTNLNGEIENITPDIDIEGDPQKKAPVKNVGHDILSKVLEPTIKPAESDDRAAMSDINIADYSGYMHNGQVYEGEALNDVRAMNQSSGEKLRRGFGKMAVTAATAFAEPFVDLTYGLIEAGVKGKERGNFEMNDIFNNSISSAMDDLNAHLSEDYAHFYTSGEQNKSAVASMGTMNFWADKFLNGAGFAIGAIASGMVTGGLGLGTKAGGAYKALRGVSKTAIRGSKAAKVGVDATKIINQGNKFGKSVDSVFSSLVGAVGESGMEARGIYDNTLEMMKNERLLGSEAYKDMDDATMEDMARSASNVGFGVNMVLVGGSNLIQFGKMFTGKYDDAISGLNKIKKTKGLKKGADAVFETRTGKWGKALNFKDYTKAALANPLTEAMQEGGQYATETGIEHFMKDHFDPEASLHIDDLLHSAVHGMGEALGTKEGQESMILGAILGGVGAPGMGSGMRSDIKAVTAKRKATEKLVTDLNAYKNTERVKDLYEAYVAHVALENKKGDALKNGDAHTYNSAEFMQFRNYVSNRIKAGQFDSMLEEITEMSEIDPAEFEGLFGMEMEQESLQALAKDLSKQAHQVKEVYDDVEYAFGHKNAIVKKIAFETSAQQAYIDNRSKTLAEKISEHSDGAISIDAAIDLAEEMEKEEYDKEKSNTETPHLEPYRNLIHDQVQEWAKKASPAKKKIVDELLKEYAALSDQREAYIDLVNQLESEEGELKVIEDYKEVQRKAEQAKQDLKTELNKKPKTSKEVQEDFLSEHLRDVEGAENGEVESDVLEFNILKRDKNGKVVLENGQPVVERTQHLKFKDKNTLEDVNNPGTTVKLTARLIEGFVQSRTEGEFDIFKSNTILIKSIESAITAKEFLLQNKQEGRNQLEAELLDLLVELEGLKRTSKVGSRIPIDNKGVRIPVKQLTEYYEQLQNKLAELEEHTANLEYDQKALTKELEVLYQQLEKSQEAAKTEDAQESFIEELDVSTLLAHRSALIEALDTNRDTLDTVKSFAERIKAMMTNISNAIKGWFKILRDVDLSNREKVAEIKQTILDGKKSLKSVQSKPENAAALKLSELYNSKEFKILERMLREGKFEQMAKYAPLLEEFASLLEDQSLTPIIGAQAMYDLRDLASKIKAFARSREAINESVYNDVIDQLEFQAESFKSGVVVRGRNTSKFKGNSTEGETGIDTKHKSKTHLKKAFVTTTGKHTKTVKGEFTDELTEDKAQLAWFKFTDNYNPESGTVKLKAITRGSNPYGSKVKFLDDHTQGLDGDARMDAEQIMLVAVDEKTGEPHLVDGHMVYTSMRGPSMVWQQDGVDMEDSDGNPAYRYSVKGMKKAEISLSVLNHKKARSTAINAAELSNENEDHHLYFSITGKTPGVAVKKGEPTSVVGKLVDSTQEIPALQLGVAFMDPKAAAAYEEKHGEKPLFTTITSEGAEVRVRIGTPYVKSDGRIVELEARNLEENEVDTIFNLLRLASKQYNLHQAHPAKYPHETITAIEGLEGVDIFQSLQDRIVWDQAGNKKYGIYFKYGTLYFAKGDGTFISMSANELVNQTNPAKSKLLREFLATKRHHVNSHTLNKKSDQAFTNFEMNSNFEVSNERVYSAKEGGYKAYLTSPEGRENESSIPMKTSLAPKSDENAVNAPQFLSTNLIFDTGIVPVKPKYTPKKTKSDKPAAKSKSKPATATAEAFDEEAMVAAAPKDFAEQQQMLAEYKEAERKEKEVKEAEEAKEEKYIPNPHGEFVGKEESEGSPAINEEAEERATEEDDELNSYRLPSEESAKEDKIDIAKERAWFQERFPDIPFEVVKDLIDGKAMGKFMIYGKVLVSRLATEGTTYHEAWHVVSNLYLTQDEVNAVYKEFRSTKGQAKTYEGVTKDIKDFTNKEVEEALAEEFRHYMLKGEFAGVLSPKKKNFFQRLKDFLMRLLWGDTTIEHVFDKIKNNGYKNARVKNKLGRANFYSTALPGKSVKYTREVMSNIDVMFFNSLAKSGTALDQFYGEMEGDNLQEYYKTYFENSIKDKKGKEDIQRDWEVVKAMHLAQLERYGFQFDQDTNIDEATGEDTEVNAVKDSAFGKTSIEQSTIKTMPKAVEMLIRTLPRRSQKVSTKGANLVVKGTEYAFAQAVDYQQTVNNLHNLLSGVETFSEMVEILYDNKSVHPEYLDLLRRLYVKKLHKDGIVTEIPVEDLTTNQHRVQTEFFKQFSKTKNDYLMSIVKEDGSVYTFDSTTQGVEKKLKEEFKANLRSQVGLTDSIVVVKDGKLQIDVNKQFSLNGKRLSLKSISDTSPKLPKASWLKILEKIGVQFTDASLLDDQFIDQSKMFVDSLANTEDVVSDLYADVDSGSQVKYFFEQEMKAREDYELSHRNPSGNTVYGISEHSFLSKIVDALKLERIPEHLIPSNNPFTAGSRILKRIFSGLGNVKFGIQIIEGLEADGKSGQGNIASKLKSPDYLAIQVNSILNGVIPFLRTSDKSTEYGINFSEVMVGNNSEFFNALRGYLIDELQVIQNFKVDGTGKEFKTYAKNGTELRFFKDILTSISIANVANGKMTPEAFVKKNKTKIDAALKVWLEKETAEMVALLKEQGMFDFSKKKGLTGFDPKVLSADIKNDPVLLEHHYSQLATRIVRNSTIGYIEQTKLFTGDLAFFKDLFKRTAGLSGTKTSPSVDERTNKWLAKNRKRKDGKKPDGKLNVITRNDVIVKSAYLAELERVLGDRIGEYAGMEEADAQGLMSFDEYREMKDRLGEWSQAMEDLYQGKIKGGTKALSRKEMMLFPPIKPMYYGPQKAEGVYAPLYLKLSLMPLLPSMIKGRNLEQLAKDMSDNQVGIHIFFSGVKVGAKGKSVKGDKRGTHAVELDKFYTEEGGMAPITKANISEIDYKYFGIQVEVAPKVKKKIKFGTQLRKLIASNLFENGAIKSITTKDGKLTGEQTQELYEEYNETIDQLIETDFNELLDKLKLTETEDGYTLDKQDFDAFKQVLLEEMTSRELNFNIIDGLDLAFESDDKLFDALINKNQIESILFSMVQNNVVRQKISGDMKVQVASTGFEVNRENIEESNELKFYTDKEGVTTRAEVKVPIPQALIPWMIEHYGSLGKLNAAIADGTVREEVKELLNLTGFRIPTQGYNSMEAMVVQEFLPAEGGPMIVVPSEIVAKTGSDFDIDKLNVLIKNFKIEDGKLVYPSEGKSHLQNKLMDILDTFLLAPENFKQLITPNTTEILEENVKNIRKLTGKKPLSRSNTDAMTLRHNFNVAQYFWSGKAGVGVTANSLVQHVLSQVTGLKLKAHQGTVAFKGFEGQTEFELGKSMDVKGENSILDVLSNFINAYVDIAKDPFVFDLNAGPDMTGVYFFLTRIGVPIKTQTLFMTQPIMVEFAKRMNTERSLLKTAKGEQSSRARIISDLMDKFGGKRKDQTLTDALLTKSLKGTLSESEHKQLQVSVLHEFSKYSEYADDLFELQQATSQDTKGVGRSRAHLKVINSKVAKVEGKDHFIGLDKMFSKTFLKGFKRVAEKSTNLYKEFFFTEMPALQEPLELLFNEFKDSRISDSDFTAILSKAEDQLITMILTTTKVDGSTIGERMEELMLGSNSLAIRLGKHQRSNKKNVLVNELLPVISSTRKGAELSQDNIRLFTQRIDAYTKDELADGFRELANGTKEEAKLAEDLVDFLLLQSGVGFSPITYMSIIPSEIYREKVQKYIDAYKGSGTNITAAFVDQFYRNNWKNAKIVPYIKGTKSNGQFSESRLKTVQTSSGEKLRMHVSNNSYQADSPYLRTTKYVGVDPKTKKKIYSTVVLKKVEEMEKTTVFEAVGALGDGHLLLEYSLDLNPVSILDKNNVGVDTEAAETLKDEQALDQIGERAVRAITRRVLKGLGKSTVATKSTKSFTSKKDLAENLRAIAKRKGAKYMHLTTEKVNEDWQKFKKTGGTFAKFVEDITNRIENC